MSACVQPVTIEVVGNPCPDPATLLWTTSESHFPGFSNAIALPTNGTQSAFFRTYAQSGGNVSASAIATGTLSYVGGPCNIQINGAMTRSGPGGYTYFGELELTIKIGSGPLLSYILIICSVIIPPGAIQMNTGMFSIPFTLPDTLGDTAVVTVISQVDYNFAGGPYTLDIQGTVVVVP